VKGTKNKALHRSHAPAWERILANIERCMHSHRGRWEREKAFDLALSTFHLEPFTCSYPFFYL